jgi:hypothetical protein
MRELKTDVGLLRGVMFDGYFKNGVLKECTLVEKNRINTPLGLLIPQYEDDGVRRKFTSSLSFYQNGALKKLSLQEQTEVDTPIGKIPAELLTFYDSGALMRVFPLNGKISGYWTENSEYGLAKSMQLNFPFGKIESKIICVNFYESGSVKSLTFWPREKLFINTPYGEIPIRIGLSLYENGSIKSVEPLKPYAVSTPIGTIMAFDIDAVGISGDLNSLKFNENGTVAELKTISNSIEVIKSDETVTHYEPTLVISHFSDELMAIKPLIVSFCDGKVYFGEDKKYSHDISDVIIKIKTFDRKSGGNACEGCK